MNLKARDLQAFRVLSKIPTWFYCAGEPLERVVYGLNRKR